jgi:hypothetical protein
MNPEKIRTTVLRRAMVVTSTKVTMGIKILLHMLIMKNSPFGFACESFVFGISVLSIWAVSGEF